MSTDSHLFFDEGGADRMPLYEGKMIQAFDHRAASVKTNFDNIVRAGQPDPTNLEQYRDHTYLTKPQSWVSASEVELRIQGTWNRKWILVFKSVTSSTNERTFIASLIPKSGVANSLICVFTGTSPELTAALYANLNSLVMDSVARNKVGGLNLNFFYVKQFPVLPPNHYGERDLAFIRSRVLELTYTANDMASWAKDMGYDGEPFTFEPVRRAQLRAELDAWYARAYGLTRNELCYILDPADVMGEDYPSETFRGLKKNEEREFGEYRTQRLVLQAWDQLETGELH